MDTFELTADARSVDRMLSRLLKLYRQLIVVLDRQRSHLGAEYASGLSDDCRESMQLRVAIESAQNEFDRLTSDSAANSDLLLRDLRVGQKLQQIRVLVERCRRLSTENEQTAGRILSSLRRRLADMDQGRRLLLTLGIRGFPPRYLDQRP